MRGVGDARPPTQVVVPLRHRSLAQRIPWLWYDHVASQPVAPSWLLALIPFAFNYGLGVLLAIWDGELSGFLLDYRWPVLFALLVIACWTLGYVPRASGQLLVSLRPWLRNSDEEIEAFRGATPELLMRCFWISAAIWGGFTVLWFVVPGADSWSPDYAHPEIIHRMPLLLAPSMAFFVGASFSMVSMGLGLFTQRISRDLSLKRGFVLQGGRASLQPFNRLLRNIWITFTLPAIVWVVVVFAINAPRLSGPWLAAVNTGVLVLGGALAIPTLVLPQLFMNRWLAKEKADELQALQSELAEVASLPQTGDPLDALPRLLRHQHLIYQIQRVQGFTATLVDAKFVMNIASSIVVIVLANIAIRTLFAVLGP